MDEALRRMSEPLSSDGFPGSGEPMASLDEGMLRRIVYINMGRLLYESQVCSRDAWRVLSSVNGIPGPVWGLHTDASILTEDIWVEPQRDTSGSFGTAAYHDDEDELPTLEGVD